MFELRPYRRNSMSAWNPFSEMEEMERRLFNNDFFSGRGLAEFKTDITDEGDYYELKADLPGFTKEDIQLQLDGDTLTIQAQRHSEHEEQEKKGKYVCCERSYGAYSRSFDVSGIRAEGITASYDSGVLTLKLPKKTVEVSSSRQISIDSNQSRTRHAVYTAGHLFMSLLPAAETSGRDTGQSPFFQSQFRTAAGDRRRRTLADISGPRYCPGWLSGLM